MRQNQLSVSKLGPIVKTTKWPKEMKPYDDYQAGTPWM